MAAAIKRADSAKPSDITAVLRKLDAHAPVTGSLKFDDKGDQRYGAISVHSLRAGRWESQLRSDVWYGSKNDTRQPIYL